VHYKCLEGFKSGVGEKTEKTSRTNRSIQEEVLRRIKEEINILATIKREKSPGFVTSSAGTAV